jgi:hypothetical protein
MNPADVGPDRVRVALLVGECPSLVGRAAEALMGRGFQVLATPSLHEAAEYGDAVPDLELAMAELQIGGGGGAEALFCLADRWPGLRCVLFVPREQVELYARALHGVCDVLVCPDSFTVAELSACIHA